MGANRDAFGRRTDPPLGPDEIRVTPRVHHSGACPDCDADLQTVEIATGVYIAQIMHDQTCPTWRGMRQRP